MTLNGVGSRTRLGLPAGGSRREPESQAHRPRAVRRRAAPLQLRSGRPLGARDGRARHDPRLHRGRGRQWAALSMTPRALFLRLLLAASGAAAGAPATALPATTGDATLAIVFDVTGSMWDDLMQVMDGASRILERSLSRRSQAIVNYALVPFHDPGSVFAGAPARPRWRPPGPPSGPESRRSPSRPPGTNPDARGLRGSRAGAPWGHVCAAAPGTPGAGLGAALPSPEPALWACGVR